MSLLLWTRKKRTAGWLRWTPWLVALAMDAPSFISSYTSSQSTSSRSLLESVELGEGRLKEAFVYYFREPMYSACVAPHIEHIQSILLGDENRSTIGRVVMRPLGELLSGYRKLWEELYFWTSAS